MRSSLVLPLSIVCTLLVLQSAIHAQEADSQSPVSVERIRAALQKGPPRLRLPAPSEDGPTFRVEVREHLYDLKPVGEEPFDPTYGLPSIGGLLMDGLAKVQSAVVNYRHGRATHRARKEVDDALAAFCATRECPNPHAGR